ncbi:uroporphyrin-III methyltransferase [Streptomonospora alba]|uniref:Uroporphyrin-III methyltransferase n=1 Tax=Streptomonospora alba TaxID=183763 RepID=A0A0C2JKK2_9ACTN|nr:uroporphyrin-III methyltransferase [Streptomonospora alba]
MARVRDTIGQEPPPGRVFLVDRLWPRGVRKTSVHYDAWLQDAAPSTELRRWLHADPDRWEEFVERYRAELADNPDALRPIREALAEGPVTLLYGARDTEHNHAVVLRDFMLESD